MGSQVETSWMGWDADWQKQLKRKHRLAAETYHESNHTSTLVVIETCVFGYKSPFLVVKNFIGIGTIISFLAWILYEITIFTVKSPWNQHFPIVFHENLHEIAIFPWFFLHFSQGLPPAPRSAWRFLDPETQFVSARHVDAAGWTGDPDQIVAFHMLQRGKGPKAADSNHLAVIYK